MIIIETPTLAEQTKTEIVSSTIISIFPNNFSNNEARPIKNKPLKGHESWEGNEVFSESISLPRGITPYNFEVDSNRFNQKKSLFSITFQILKLDQ